MPECSTNVNRFIKWVAIYSRTFITGLLIADFTNMKKERRKRSVIWTTPFAEFENIVHQSNSIADICRRFKFGIKGGTYTAIKKRIETEKIDTSHFQPLHRAKWASYVTKDVFLSRLQKHTSLNRDFVKRKLIEFDLVKNQCVECSMGTIWNNKPLVLHLDHINGDGLDYRLENLRLLCPNCHTQTSTFAGRKMKKYYRCSVCGNQTAGYGERCFDCGQVSRRKIIRPSKVELERMVLELPMTKIAKQFGVSDNAVRKWCKSYGMVGVTGNAPVPSQCE